jgi:hypothetical protein
VFPLYIFWVCLRLMAYRRTNKWLLKWTTITIYSGFIGPFHLMYTHPPMDEVNKIWTPKKKRSKCRHKHPPQKLRNFCLTPQKKCKDQRMPLHTTPQKRLFQTPSEILVHRGVCILNGMAHSCQTLRHI